MPRKTTRSGQAKQAQKRSTRASNRQVELQRKSAARVRAAIKHAEDVRLRTILKRVAGKGIYEPKSTVLTKWRRTRLRKIDREFGDFLNRKDFIFAPVPKKQRKEVRTRAPAMELKATRSGVFIPRQGFRQAKVAVNEKTGDIDIEWKGKVQRGPRGSLKTKKRRPLAAVDDIERQKDRIGRSIKALGPLGPREAYGFSVIENDSAGYSHRAFDTLDELLDYLDLYRQKTPDGRYTRDLSSFVHFLTLVEVEKTTSQADWLAEHPPLTQAERKARDRARKAQQRHDARGRRIVSGYKAKSKKPVGKRPRKLWTFAD